jgi:hypothetical protein
MGYTSHFIIENGYVGKEQGIAPPWLVLSYILERQVGATTHHTQDFSTHVKCTYLAVELPKKSLIMLIHDFLIWIGSLICRTFNKVKFPSTWDENKKIVEKQNKKWETSFYRKETGIIKQWY